MHTWYSIYQFTSWFTLQTSDYYVIIYFCDDSTSLMTSLKRATSLGSHEHIAQYPLHHLTYAHANIEVATSNGLRDAFTNKKYSLTFTLSVKVTQNIALYPLHHVT